MSGFEVAGIVLGGIPIIIAGLHHWRQTAEVCGYYRRIRKEHKKCLRDVQLYEILYKRNLEELLRPIVDDATEVPRLISESGSQDWCNEILEERLESRLQESYSLYMEIINDMNEAVEELKDVLYLNDVGVQGELGRSTQPSLFTSAKTKMDFELFRVKFSFGEKARDELFDRLAENNQRLEKLLKTSDNVSILRNTTSTITKSTAALETVFKVARRKAESLFKAFQKAWQCSCEQHHFANLRLEHRTLPDTCFEVILMYTSPASPSAQGDRHWTWREIECGEMANCSCERQHLLSPPDRAPQRPTKPGLSANIRGKKRVAFEKPPLTVPNIDRKPPVIPRMNLCQRLGDRECDYCMGIIDHDNEIYHLHPITKLGPAGARDPLTLDTVLSQTFEGNFSRRQRYYIALLLASSVAQLQSTAWLRIGLAKQDVMFFRSDGGGHGIPSHEPFIRQGFLGQEKSWANTNGENHDFYALGILLLELCFGRRLEDHPSRQKYPSEPKEVKQACDLMVAMDWSKAVEDEGGEGYASAVSWCFTKGKLGNQSWRSEIIKNVIRPLEACQQHFKTFTA